MHHDQIDERNDGSRRTDARVDFSMARFVGIKLSLGSEFQPVIVSGSKDEEMFRWPNATKTVLSLPLRRELAGRQLHTENSFHIIHLPFTQTHFISTAAAVER
jgi:hypothetical protein